jgi:hypothetical protein
MNQPYALAAAHPRTRIIRSSQITRTKMRVASNIFKKNMCKTIGFFSLLCTASSGLTFISPPRIFTFFTAAHGDHAHGRPGQVPDGRESRDLPVGGGHRTAFEPVLLGPAAPARQVAGAWCRLAQILIFSHYVQNVAPLHPALFSTAIGRYRYYPPAISSFATS